MRVSKLPACQQVNMSRYSLQKRWLYTSSALMPWLCKSKFGFWIYAAHCGLRDYANLPLTPCPYAVPSLSIAPIPQCRQWYVTACSPSCVYRTPPLPAPPATTLVCHLPTTDHNFDAWPLAKHGYTKTPVSSLAGCCHHRRALRGHRINRHRHRRRHGRRGRGLRQRHRAHAGAVAARGHPALVLSQRRGCGKE